MTKLTHLGEDGRPRMVDVSSKPNVDRVAVAKGFVSVPADLLASIAGGASAKGNVIAAAELAGIMAAKRTADLIPLCHPLGLDSIDVHVTQAEGGLEVTARTSTTARTGVEMEAMTAVAIACLTLYDMLKGTARDVTIERIRLVEKRGGKSGSWHGE